MLTISHILIAVIEFFLINWLGKHSISSGYHQISFVQTIEDAPLFNTVFRVLAPAVFLVLSAVIWFSLNMDGLVEHYWMVTVYYFAVRWAFNLLLGRARLLNWPKQFLTAALAVLLSYWVASRLLADPELVLPSAQGLKDQLWIVILAFLYVTAGKINWPSIGRAAELRKRDYLRAAFVRFSDRFGSVVKEASSGPAAEALSYAILLYESFNRPPLYQAVENRILFPLGAARTLGPMQVVTRHRRSESELVRLGVGRVNDALSQAFEKMKREAPEAVSINLRRDPEAGIELPYDDDFDVSEVRFEDVPPYYQDLIIGDAAAEYNIRSDYPGEIVGIFSFLRDEFYTTLYAERSQPTAVAG